jgi:ubiquinone/menaquinone biosynthesis C-methylase UbiE
MTKPTRIERAMVLMVSPLIRPFVYRQFVERIGLKGGEKVIDFGSGWGDESYYISPLLSDGGHLTLLDVSSEWQQVARRRLRRFSNMTFVNSDIFHAGLADCSFDVVVVHYVLHDIPPREREGTVKEIARKLRPGGFIYLNEPLVKQHGMPEGEIVALMNGAGLVRESSRVSLGFFEGKFSRPPSPC